MLSTNPKKKKKKKPLLIDCAACCCSAKNVLLIFLFSPNFPLEIRERKRSCELHPEGGAELLDGSWEAPGIPSCDSHPDPHPCGMWGGEDGAGNHQRAAEGRRACSSQPGKYQKPADKQQNKSNTAQEIRNDAASLGRQELLWRREEG